MNGRSRHFFFLVFLMPFLLMPLFCSCAEETAPITGTAGAIGTTGTTGTVVTAETSSAGTAIPAESTAPATEKPEAVPNVPDYREYFAPASTEATAVHINQVGYLPQSAKVAVVVGGGVSFDLIRIADGEGEVVMSGPVLAVRNKPDPLSGDVCCYADFTDWEKPGTYQLYINGAAGFCVASFPFTIDDNAYDAVRRDSLRMLYYQRCGTALEEPYAEGFVHSACHAADGTYLLRDSIRTDGNAILSLDGAVAVDVTGGWHEAGDCSKNVPTASATIATLCYTYLLWPEQFTDDSGIPESGNGTPDILDEARWGLEWLLKMQRENGGFCYTAFPWTHPAIAMPDRITDTYYVWAPTVDSTGYAVGCLALGARIFWDSDPDFAANCLTAAKSGWLWLVDHPEDKKSVDVNLPCGYGSIIGTYFSSKDERLFAATELAVATGSHENDDLIYDLATEVFVRKTAGAISFDRSSAAGFCALSLVTNNTAFSLPAPTERMIFREMENQSESAYRLYLGTGYNAVTDTFIWTSNASVLNAAMRMTVAQRHNPELDYSAPIQAAYDYILGRNPLSVCFVTGHGSNPALHPHHSQMICDGIDRAIPGYLVFGPYKYSSLAERHPTVTQYLPADTPDMKSYIDNADFYACNEIQTDVNSFAVFVGTAAAALGN